MLSVRRGSGVAFGTAFTLVLLCATALLAAPPTVDHVVRFDEADFALRATEQGTRLDLQGASALTVEGRPLLPSQSLLFVLPRGTRIASVEVLDAVYAPMEGTVDRARALLSSDGEPAREADLFAGDDDARARSGVYPVVAAVAGATSSLRGWSVGSVDLVPARVLADGRLERLERARLRLHLEIDPHSNDFVTRKVAWPGVAAHDAERVREVVRNREDVDRWAPSPGVDPAVARVDFSILGGRAKVYRPVDGPIEHLIVTNEAMRPEFERLAQRRTQEGLRSAVVSIEQIQANARPGGDLQETIRYFLRSAYEQWGLQYVLMGGDAEVLPPRYARSFFYPVGGFTDIPTDLYFAALDGNWNDDADGIFAEAYQDFLNVGDGADFLAELAIGRAPAKTLSEAQTFVDKTLRYSDPTDLAYLGRALFLSEVLFPQAWNGVDPITLDGAIYSENIVFNSIIGGGNLMQSWRMYENFGAYFGSIAESKQAALDSMQTGNFGLVNHVGHGFYYNMSVGDANIFVADAITLSNSPHEFILHALNCSSGAFDFDALLERFLSDPDGGTCASIGSSRAAFPTTADVYQQAFYEEVFVNGNVRLGDAQAAARARSVASTNVEGSHRWTHLTYHLFGDPAMRMWRQQPAVPVVTHASSLTLGEGSLSVQVNAAGAVAGATVAATRSDGGFSVGTTDATGLAVLDLTGLTDRTGNVTLVVSGANLDPYTATIGVAAAGVHVRATANAVVDDGSGSSIGDGDGQPDSGETVEWWFQFENNGGVGTASGLTAKLVPVDAPGATVVVDSATVGSVSAGSPVFGVPPFVVQLDPSIVDGSVLSFRVDTTDGVQTWSQPAQLQVLSPEVEVSRLRWDDTALGNGDGVIDPGETVDLIVELVNWGTGTANAITGTLTSASPNVSIVSASDSWANLGSGMVQTGASGLRIIESDTSIENWMTLTLADDRGHVWTHDFELRLPAAPAQPALDTAFGPDRIAIEMPATSEPHFYGYRVYRSDSAAGPFVEATRERVVRSGFYMDTGLAQLTRYYYQVALVDSSGVESPFSPQASASTAPPEAAGFPLPFAREMAGAIAVGNMRGDGLPVVTFGSDWIYAIAADGSELLDGDGDSQTLGPLGGDPANLRFTPSGVSMVDLDGDGLDEVIGSNWLSSQVYVLRADGSNFPGWPQQMNNKSWATPVVGDLDNDGDMEIVVNNVGARTYVWNHDGTDFFDGDANPATNGVFQIRTGENFNRSSPALYDLDGDGNLEIIFGTHFRNGNDNFVYALKTDGTNAPGWPKNTGPNGFCVGHATLGDLDGDGSVEICLQIEDGLFHIWGPDGSERFGSPYPVFSQAALRDSKAPAAALGDFDKNGDLELVVVSIIDEHSCDVMIMDHDGTIWPGWPRTLPGLSESSPLIGDINGDLSMDIVFGIGGGTDNDPNVLYAFNADGTDVQGFPITLPGAVRAVPVIDDFDLDGDVDVVYAGFDRFVHVWDMPFPYRSYLTPWKTFQANNRRTGVYLQDRATSTAIADLRVRPGIEGVLIESIFGGVPTADLQVDIDRRELPSEVFERIASGVDLDGDELVYLDRGARPGATYEYRLLLAGGAAEFLSETVSVPVQRARLLPNVPNPFNPSTTLRFEVPGTAGSQVPTRLAIYDLGGRLVRVLLDEPLSPGAHERLWDGRDASGRPVGSGVYFARLRSAGQGQTLKMTLVK